MSTPAGLRKPKKASDAVAVAPARTRLGRGGGSTAPPPSLGRGGGLPVLPPSHGRGGCSTATPPSIDRGFPSSAAPWMDSRGFPNSTTAWMDSHGFSNSPFPPSPYGGDLPRSSAWHDGENVDPSSPGSWDKDVRPPGGFMSYFGNQGQNSHLVGAAIHSSPPNQAHNASSSSEVEIRYGNDSTRTEKRIMWAVEEDVE